MFSPPRNSNRLIGVYSKVSCCNDMSSLPVPHLLPDARIIISQVKPQIYL
jgi:hypothetical protein